jgi:hypothetical protein
MHQIVIPFPLSPFAHLLVDYISEIKLVIGILRIGPKDSSRFLGDSISQFFGRKNPHL